MGVPYATREQVKDSLEVNQSAYADRLIDRNLLTASLSIEGQLRRRYYPEQRSFKMDWPNYQYAPSWHLWLGINELISLTSVVSGGIDITTSAVLRRQDDIAEPPYGLLEISLAGAGAFASGPTFQQSVVITGLAGYSDTATDTNSGVLSATLTNVAVTATINPVSGYLPIGVWSLLKIDNERLLVTERTMITTGITITTNPAASQAVSSIGVSDGTQFAIGEIILIDAERMKIVDIAGNNLIVNRAFDGTVLAAHTSGATVFAFRSFRLKRGVLGSTAAQHLTSAAIYVHEYPAIVNQLAVAETVVLLEQNSSAYARTIGTGGREHQAGIGDGLADLREQALRAVGRGIRVEAI